MKPKQVKPTRVKQKQDTHLDDLAYLYVMGAEHNADGFHGNAPWWYGWALTAAFKAGYEAGQETEKGASDGK